MFEEAKKIYNISHRDEIRKLPVSDQRKLQVSSAKTISLMKSDILFVDTHLFIRTKEGFWPGLPQDVLHALSPTNLVLVEATPQEIMKRRLEDRTRYRDAVTEESLEEEIGAARGMFLAAAVLTGSPIAFVRNEQGKADKAVEVLLKAIADT
jgi:adenylate kinase